MTDAPTTTERILRSMRSSDLTLVTHYTTALDFVIATGWTSRHSIGVTLLRLLAEWQVAMPTALRESGNRATAEVFALMQLRTLNQAKQELFRFAVRLAIKTRFMRSDEVVAAITGKVLGHWLDPTCKRCDGRGFTGGAGAPVRVCRPCAGTGKTTAHLSCDEIDADFARALLDQIDVECDRVEAMVRRVMRQG